MQVRKEFRLRTIGYAIGGYRGQVGLVDAVLLVRQGTDGCCLTAAKTTDF